MSGVPGNKIWTESFLNARSSPEKFAVSISNPPFSLAQEFIEHSLAFAPWVIHLLRLNYLGSEKRNAFFRENMPDVYVVPDRISFTGDGKSDSIEYAWFVWRPLLARSSGELRVLATTPLEERRTT